MRACKPSPLRVVALLALGFAMTSTSLVLGPAERASAAQVRYTLAASYSGTYERHWTRRYPESTPPALEWDDWFESASYVGRSTRPFVITRGRDGRSFAFTAKLTGTISVVGSGRKGFFGDYAGDGTTDPQDCQWTKWMWSDAGARVLGGIYLKYGDKMMEGGAGQADHSVNYVSDMRCSPSGFTFPVRSDDWGLSTSFGWPNIDAVQLRRHYGRAFTVTSEGNYPAMGEGGSTKNRLVLRFTPVAQEEEEPEPKRERWQVEVAGRDTWSWGMYTTLGAGVNVKWAHRTTLEVEDGKLISATGKVRIVDATKFSDVDGAFTVTQRTTTPPPYEITKSRKSGDRVELGLLRLGSSEYRADFTVQAGPQLLQTLRAMNLPQPDARYQAMVARGPVLNRVYPLVPLNPRIVVRLRPGVYRRETDAFSNQLPCSKFKGKEPECFLNRGGEIITVRRLR